MSKKSVGRPSKYTLIEKRLDEVEKLAICGLTDKQLGYFFGVSITTITSYKDEHPEFLATLKKGKMFADTDVVYSLYKSAQGFEYEEVTKEERLGKDGDVIGTMTKTTMKYYPPNVTSCIYWLRNRKQWIDKLPEKLDIDVPYDDIFKDMSDKELKEYADKGRNGK